MALCDGNFATQHASFESIGHALNICHYNAGRRPRPCDPGIPDYVQSKLRQLAAKFTSVNRLKYRILLSTSVIGIIGRLPDLMFARTIQDGARTPAGVLATVNHHLAIY
jgi:hypothetical protein